MLTTKGNFIVVQAVQTAILPCTNPIASTGYVLSLFASIHYAYVNVCVVNLIW